jgi:hypothetical protein
LNARFLTALILPGLLLAAPIAGSEESPAEATAAVTAGAEAMPADARPDDAAVPATANADDDNFVLPPGFKPMKRGKFTLYCRKESVMGTRLPAQKCYDEDGIRQLVQSLREEREKIDQMRRICGSMNACGGGG